MALLFHKQYTDAEIEKFKAQKWPQLWSEVWNKPPTQFLSSKPGLEEAYRTLCGSLPWGEALRHSQAENKLSEFLPGSDLSHDTFETCIDFLRDTVSAMGFKLALIDSSTLQKEEAWSDPYVSDATSFIVYVKGEPAHDNYYWFVLYTTLTNKAYLSLNISKMGNSISKKCGQAVMEKADAIRLELQQRLGHLGQPDEEIPSLDHDHEPPTLDHERLSNQGFPATDSGIVSLSQVLTFLEYSFPNVTEKRSTEAEEGKDAKRRKLGGSPITHLVGKRKTLGLPTRGGLLYQYNQHKTKQMVRKRLGLHYAVMAYQAKKTKAKVQAPSPPPKAKAGTEDKAPSSPEAKAGTKSLSQHPTQTAATALARMRQAQALKEIVFIVQDKLGTDRLPQDFQRKLVIHDPTKLLQWLKQAPEDTFGVMRTLMAYSDSGPMSPPPRNYEGYYKDRLVPWMLLPRISPQQLCLYPQTAGVPKTWTCLVCEKLIFPDMNPREWLKEPMLLSVRYPDWNSCNWVDEFVKSSVEKHQEYWHPEEPFIFARKNTSKTAKPMDMVYKVLTYAATKIQVPVEDAKVLTDINHLQSVLENGFRSALWKLQHDAAADYGRSKTLHLLDDNNELCPLPELPPNVLQTTKQARRKPVSKESEKKVDKRKRLKVVGGSDDTGVGILLLKAYAGAFIKDLRDGVLLTLTYQRQEVLRFLQVCPPSRIRNLVDLLFRDVVRIRPGVFEGTFSTGSPFIHTDFLPTFPPPHPAITAKATAASFMETLTAPVEFNAEKVRYRVLAKPRQSDHRYLERDGPLPPDRDAAPKFRPAGYNPKIDKDGSLLEKRIAEYKLWQQSQPDDAI